MSSETSSRRASRANPSRRTGRLAHVSLAPAVSIAIIAADELPEGATPVQPVVTRAGTLAFVMRPPAEPAAPAETAAPAAESESEAPSESEAEAPAAAPAKKRVRTGVAAKKRTRTVPAPAAAVCPPAIVAAAEAAPVVSPVAVLEKRIRRMDPENLALLKRVYDNGGAVPDGVAMPRSLMMPKGSEKPRTTRMISTDGKKMTADCMTAFANVLAKKK